MVIVSDASGQERHFCRDCHNEVMAQAAGIENYTDFIKTYQVQDAEGNIHVFEIDKQIFALGIKWVAYETRDGDVEGYQFVFYAKFGDDPVTCLQKLYSKINKGLSKIYVKQEELHGQTAYSLPYDKINGRIEWDDEHNGEIPKIVIDGKTYSWHEVGRMLTSYEGWNLEIKISEAGNKVR
jgi:hypothetical protein